jgi:uncharacterized protein (DUF1499 family)
LTNVAVPASRRGFPLVSNRSAAGRIEARQTSRWFRFTDDIVIRVAAETPESRIDMRSESRQRRSDFGLKCRPRPCLQIAAARNRVEDSMNIR